METVANKNRQGFSHREADAKSLLDEAFRRGMGGSGGVRRAIVGAVRAVDGNEPAVGLRNRSRCAQRERSRTLLGRRTRHEVSQSAFQVTGPSGLRHAETRILAEEPGPATAAVGTARQGRLVIRRLVEALIGQFRSAGSTPPRGVPSWAVAPCRSASPSSRAPRHDRTGLASRGARARSIGPCESLAAGRAGGSAGGTQRRAAARCATRRRRGLSSGRSHGFDPCRGSVHC